MDDLSIRLDTVKEKSSETEEKSKTLSKLNNKE